MGNADLRQLAVLREVPFDELDGETVAVDEALGLDADLALSVREGIDDARR